MTHPKRSGDDYVYQIKVTLKGSNPPIWRRVEVPSHITLYKMHRILQITMGWQNSHLHEFKIAGISYGENHPEYGLEMKAERRARLDELVPEVQQTFVYDYNLDESWEHELLVENILRREIGVHYPLCVAGDRACPPEDCGGWRGYGELLEIIQNPEDVEYQKTLEWLGGGFDPEAFDLDAVNKELKKIR